MESRPETPRKPVDKKSPSMGNNIIWYLLALGIGTVFLVALLASQPDVEIPYSALVQADPDGQRRKERARGEAAGHDRSSRR